jgi:hypothetical protein
MRHSILRFLGLFALRFLRFFILRLRRFRKFSTAFCKFPCRNFTFLGLGLFALQSMTLKIVSRGSRRLNATNFEQAPQRRDAEQSRHCGQDRQTPV